MRKSARHYLAEPAAWAWAISILAGLAFWRIAPLVFTNDTPGYIEGARGLLHLHGGNYPYFRTPGFHVLLLLTGAAQGLTLYVLVFLQWLMGVAIPVLVYYALAWIRPGIALAASILCSLSLIPVVNSFNILPNQFFFFLMIGSTLMACFYLKTREVGFLYLLAILCFLTVMIRPQGSYIFIAFFAAIIPFERTRIVHWAMALAVAICLQLAYSSLRPFFVHPITGPVVLLPYSDTDDFVPGDDVLTKRALIMVRANLYDNARLIKYLIADKDKSRLIDIAIVSQHLANNEQLSAQALTAQFSDETTRNQALQTLALSCRMRGDTACERQARAFITLPGIRAELEAQKSSVGDALAKAYSEIPPEEGLAPRRYVSGLDLTDAGGKVLFFNAYAARIHYPAAMVLPENGPATAELQRLMEAYLASFPASVSMFPELTSRTPHDAVLYMLTANLTIEQVFSYHWAIWQMTDTILGPTRADKLLKHVVLEFAKAHPSALADIYIQKVAEGLTLHNLYQFRENSPGMFPNNPPLEAGPRFDHEIARSQRHMADYQALDHLYYQGYPPVYRVLLGMAAVALVLGGFTRSGRRYFRVILMAWLVVMQQLALCAMTAGVSFNYTSIICLYITIAAMIGVHILLNLISPKSTFAGQQPA